ncbi:MAG TPA: hypothetical protein VFG04_24105 [Planctomycetaceae bacterium]|jgi:hypothetical protein|nr:hypothetical protein [Planctomycetaceae bacterium]
MSEKIRVRANRSTGELEVEGTAQVVAEWWARLWPELRTFSERRNGDDPIALSEPAVAANDNGQPEIFGEFFTQFRSNVSDVDKVLIAAAFVQSTNQERIFTTKAANELLLDQNLKVANASENVRRLMHSKRVFGVSNGKYRVSAIGFESLNALKVNA